MACIASVVGLHYGSDFNCLNCINMFVCEWEGVCVRACTLACVQLPTYHDTK